MIMYDDCELSEIEERLYSQIYHSTDMDRTQHRTQHNKTINVNPNKRYFNTAAIPNISVRINFQNRQKTRYASEEYNLKKKRNKPTSKIINEQRLRDLVSVSNFEDINLKEIKARIDAFPEFIKYLPQYIRKKLKKMNKRIAFIQKKKYLASFNRANRISIVAPSVGEQIKHSRIQNKIKSEIVINEFDEKDNLKSKKIKFIEISSSDDETQTTKTPELKPKDVFKRPDDDDVIFIEPITADVINLELESESNCSVSTKSSISKQNDKKDLLTTPESNNSNDFLENTLPDNVSSGFNFELHGTDFAPAKDSSAAVVKDISGSESSCSFAACDLGGLLTSNKCALFNEVDFESMSKNIFEESNMESFGNYITPNRRCNKAARSVLQAASKSSAGVLLKKSLNEQLPNLSCIIPEELKDLEEVVEVGSDVLMSDGKRKKKIRKTIDVEEISCKTKKEKCLVDGIVDEKLRIKRKKVLQNKEQANLVENTTKKKKKHKKNDLISISVNTDLCTEHDLKKKKKIRSHKKSDCEIIHEKIVNIQNSSEFDEATTKKRKRKNKTLTTHTETDVQTTDQDTLKKKRKSNKSDVSFNTASDQSLIKDDQNKLSAVKTDSYNNDVILVDSSVSSVQLDSDIFELEAQVCNSTSANQSCCISISDSDVSVSSELDFDFSSVKGEDVHIANVEYKQDVDYFDNDGLESIYQNMSDDASLWRILTADRYPSKSIKYNKLRCRKCSEIGHYAKQCKNKPVSICYLCAGRGHLEPRCPNKICRNCGRQSNFFTTFCSKCAYTKHILCKICKMKGHDQSRCPDLWRRYHLTIMSGPIIQPPREDALLAPKWCSGCGKQGHLEYQCQYFAREYCPTIPYVVDYKDHLFKENNSSLITLPSETSPKSLIHSANVLTTEILPSLLNISVVEQLPQLKNKNSLENSNNKTSDTKLSIPQHIASSSTNTKTDLVATSTKESLNCTSFDLKTSSESEFSQSPLLFDPSSKAIVNYSTQCPVSYLHAKYLCFHEVGVSKIVDLSKNGTTKININPDGNIKIQSSIETMCDLSKMEILDHLLGVCQLTIPTEKTLLIGYLEEILVDLSKEYSVTDLRTCIEKLQNNISLNKSIIFQQLNMMIYGHFKWDYGVRYIDKIQVLLNTIKQHDNTADKCLNELKDCLRYIIEFPRPIHFYSDIIDCISDGKQNFFNVESLRIREEQPAVVKATIVVDPLKCDYVKNSFQAKFMIFRWTSRLNVTYSDECFSLELEGQQEDVASAIKEFGTVVGDGPTLPDSKWAVFNIISQIFRSIDNLQSDGDNISNNMMQFLYNAHKSKRCLLRKIHFHLIATRGLNSGFEKLAVLREFVNNYKPCLENDHFNASEIGEIQEAFDTVQFNTSRTISAYKSNFKNPSANTTQKIILDNEEYRILNEAKEHAWLKNIDLSSAKEITSKCISVSIISSIKDRKNLKLIILDYLDHVYILDDNPKALIVKLEDSLKKLWAKPFTRNKAQIIFNRIHNIQSKKVESYHIDILRKLYEQLNIYLFGCCRLDPRTKADIPVNNNVDILRAYIAYLATVNLVPADVQKSIYQTYNSIFCKQKIEAPYSSLIKVAWGLYKKYEQIDRGTTLISDQRLKEYLTRSSVDTTLLFAHSVIQDNPIIQHEDVQNFVNDSFMIIQNNLLVNHGSPVDIRKESFKLFCDSYSNIAANLSISLRSVDEIKSLLDIRKANDLLHRIKTLEDSCAKCSLIAHKYQIMNIYLFGCCFLMDGLDHLNLLKSCYLEFSQPDKKDQLITDVNFMNKLICSYEYIFWKGKKPQINYNNLLNQINVTNDNAVTTISLHSRYIYDYFTHVTQGIDLVNQCSEQVQVNIVEDEINENGFFITLIGGSTVIDDVTKIFLAEIDRLDTYKDIPFQIDSFRKYLNSKIEDLISTQNTVLPLRFVQEVKAMTQLKPQCECMNVRLITEFLRFKLNKYIFGDCQSDEGQQHFCTLINLASEFHDKRNTSLSINQIDTLHRCLQFFFSKKLMIRNYEYYLHNYASMEKIKGTSRKLAVLPLVYEYIKSINDLSYLSLTNMQLVFDQTSPFVSVSGSNSYINLIRDIFCQYNNILSKVPKNRHDLIIFLNDSIQIMQKGDDVKSLWINICLNEQYGSNRSAEVQDLYVRLHRQLFGFFELGHGKALKQILSQHLINLKMKCNPCDIIPMEILQEIFFALEYIEGSVRKFSTQEYDDLINESCKIKNKNKSIPPIIINSSFTALKSEGDINEFIEPAVNQNALHKNDNVTQNFAYKNSSKNKNFAVKKQHTVQVHQNISRRFSHYLRQIRAGNLFVTKLRRLVHVEINVKSMILIGSEHNVKTALTLLDSQHTVNHKACYEMRVQIKISLQSIRQRKQTNVANLYTKALTLFGKRRAQLFTTIHSYLFGKLKLCDGAYHMDVLNKFLHGTEIIKSAQLKVIQASFNYIFGGKKKSVDYESIIKFATGLNKPK